MRKHLQYAIVFVSIVFVTSVLPQHVSAATDIVAVSADGHLALLKSKCGGDSSGLLRLAVLKNPPALKFGCWLLNKHSNAIIKWSDGAMQEFDGSLFEPPLTSVHSPQESTKQPNPSSDSETWTTGPSFDCGKARSKSEHLICDDRQLSAMDLALASLYGKAKRASSNSPQFRSENSREWRWRQSYCNTKSCLLRWYANRKVELEKYLTRTTRIPRNSAPITLAWSTSGPFTGILHRRIFQDCCWNGAEHPEAYVSIQLDTPIRLSGNPDDDTEGEVPTVSTIATDLPSAATENGIRATITCKALSPGINGHYAEEVNCTDTKIIKESMVPIVASAYKASNSTSKTAKANPDVIQEFSIPSDITEDAFRKTFPDANCQVESPKQTLCIIDASATAARLLRGVAFQCNEGGSMIGFRDGKIESVMCDLPDGVGATIQKTLIAHFGENSRVDRKTILSMTQKVQQWTSNQGAIILIHSTGHDIDGYPLDDYSIIVSNRVSP